MAGFISTFFLVLCKQNHNHPIACHSRASEFRVTASQALMYLLNLKPPMQGQALQLRPLIAGPSGKVCA